MAGIVLDLLCVSWLGAVAPFSAAALTATNDAEIQQRILDEELDQETRVLMLARARASFPQQVSASFGALVAKQPASYDCTTVCSFRGFLFQVEPGLSGGQLSAGYAVVFGETGRTRRFLGDVYLAYGVKAALLKSWGDADLTPEDQSLAGVEGDFTVIGVNFSLGVFRHVGSGRPEDDWIVTGGVGWGF